MDDLVADRSDGSLDEKVEPVTGCVGGKRIE